MSWDSGYHGTEGWTDGLSKKRGKKGAAGKSNN